MQRWKKRYFSELLSEENQYELQNHFLKVEGPILGVTEKEVEEALRKMKKRGKAPPGPLGVTTTDLFKYEGETGERELKKVFFELIETEEERAPTEWGSNYTIPIYKGKGGDALLCGKYRGVRLLEHGMKLWEKILEKVERYSEDSILECLGS